MSDAVTPQITEREYYYYAATARQLRLDFCEGHACIVNPRDGHWRLAWNMFVVELCIVRV